MLIIRERERERTRDPVFVFVCTVRMKECESAYCMGVCGCVQSVCQRDTQTESYHCAAGATRVIYQSGALAWKGSFLSSDREVLCVSAVKYALSHMHLREEHATSGRGYDMSVVGCIFCLISQSSRTL